MMILVHITQMICLDSGNFSRSLSAKSLIPGPLSRVINLCGSTASVLELTHTSSYQRVVKSANTLQVHLSHFDSLKVVLVGVFIPGKLEQATDSLLPYSCIPHYSYQPTAWFNLENLHADPYCI